MTVSETEAELVAPPVSTDCGTERVPVRVPPAARVIVYVALTGSETSAVIGTDDAIVPVPIPPVKFAVPEIVMPLAPIAAVAFTVTVVLIVAAGATALSRTAEARIAHTLVISW